jgi:hypothetical protein
MEGQGFNCEWDEEQRAEYRVLAGNWFAVLNNPGQVHICPTLSLPKDCRLWLNPFDDAKGTNVLCCPQAVSL